MLADTKAASDQQTSLAPSDLARQANPLSFAFRAIVARRRLLQMPYEAKVGHIGGSRMFREAAARRRPRCRETISAHLRSRVSAEMGELHHERQRRHVWSQALSLVH